MTAWRPVVDSVVGRFSAASNATLLGWAGGDPVIYKPHRGSRPLHDFDASTLAAREVLAYRVAVALGFDSLVPETTFGDGPLGPGAVQRWVDPDPGFDPVPMIIDSDPALWPIALLDTVANNADRKVGHILRCRATGGLRAIDHGLTFHPDPKLRTVLWGFAGRRFPGSIEASLSSLQARMPGLLTFAEQHLGPAEAEALDQRVVSLLADPVHPEPPADRPALPWPPY